MPKVVYTSRCHSLVTYICCSAHDQVITCVLSSLEYCPGQMSFPGMQCTKHSSPDCKKFACWTMSQADMSGENFSTSNVGCCGACKTIITEIGSTEMFWYTCAYRNHGGDFMDCVIVVRWWCWCQFNLQIEDLPSEILCKLLRLLDLTDRARSEAVCKAFHSLLMQGVVEVDLQLVPWQDKQALELWLMRLSHASGSSLRRLSLSSKKEDSFKCRYFDRDWSMKLEGTHYICLRFYTQSHRSCWTFPKIAAWLLGMWPLLYCCNDEHMCNDFEDNTIGTMLQAIARE